MSRYALFFALAIMLAFSGLAMAEEYYREGAPLPTNAQHVEGVSEWDGEKWVSTNDAKAFNSGGSDGNHCNRECWDFALETHISVAQWIDWSINSSRKDWRVLKPGIYAGDSIRLTIKSNNDVLFRYWAEDAEYLGEDASPPIDIGFGLVKGDTGQATNPNLVGGLEDFHWGATAEEPVEIIIPYDDVKGDGGKWRVYDAIEVTEEHRSSDYHGTHYFNICVTNLKHWVDPETGGFNDDFNNSGANYPSDWREHGY